MTTERAIVGFPERQGVPLQRFDRHAQPGEMHRRRVAEEEERSHDRYGRAGARLARQRWRAPTTPR